jgi:DNA (cytosine-5)-methyltransferase 1
MDRKMPKQTYKAVSLFSGGMGLDLGLEQTGRFRVVACVEKEPAFCQTIQANRQAGRLDPGLKVFDREGAKLGPPNFAGRDD